MSERRNDNVFGQENFISQTASKLERSVPAFPCLVNVLLLFAGTREGVLACSSLTGFLGHPSCIWGQEAQFSSPLACELFFHKLTTKQFGNSMFLLMRPSASHNRSVAPCRSLVRKSANCARDVLLEIFINRKIFGSNHCYFTWFRAYVSRDVRRIQGCYCCRSGFTIPIASSDLLLNPRLSSWHRYPEHR